MNIRIKQTMHYS